MTDYNVRDVFWLFTGRCGHKWVSTWGTECAVCGDTDHWEDTRADTDSPPRCKNVVAWEQITVNFHPHSDTLRKVERRIKRNVRENRRRKRKTATIISLADHRTPPPSDEPAHVHSGACFSNARIRAWPQGGARTRRGGFQPPTYPPVRRPKS